MIRPAKRTKIREFDTLCSGDIYALREEDTRAAEDVNSSAFKFLVLTPLFSPINQSSNIPFPFNSLSSISLSMSIHIYIGDIHPIRDPTPIPTRCAIYASHGMTREFQSQPTQIHGPVSNPCAPKVGPPSLGSIKSWLCSSGVRAPFPHHRPPDPSPNNEDSHTKTRSAQPFSAQPFSAEILSL